MDHTILVRCEPQYWWHHWWRFPQVLTFLLPGHRWSANVWPVSTWLPGPKLWTVSHLPLGQYQILVKASQGHPKYKFVYGVPICSKTSNIFSDFVLTVHVVMPLYTINKSLLWSF